MHNKTLNKLEGVIFLSSVDLLSIRNMLFEGAQRTIYMYCQQTL